MPDPISTGKKKTECGGTYLSSQCHKIGGKKENPLSKIAREKRCGCRKPTYQGVKT
jgi:hypothetical protein